MAVETDVQSVVDKYARALEGPRLIFDLYPKPRPQGGPPERYRPLPAAIILSVIGIFEGFAEDLVAALLYKQGFGWAYIAHHSDLTNPSVNDLRKKLDDIGIGIELAADWTTPLPRQTSLTGWKPWAPVNWDDLLKQSDGWMQVRHCLAHGLATGLGPEVWPGPLDKRSAKNQQKGARPPAAGDVLAKTKSANKKALQLYPAIGCARIYTGIRPGEKLSEELAGQNEQTRPTSHAKIRIWQLPTASPVQMRQTLDELSTVIHRSKQEIVAALCRAVPEFRPDGAIVPASPIEPELRVVAEAA